MDHHYTRGSTSADTQQDGGHEAEHARLLEREHSIRLFTSFFELIKNAGLLPTDTNMYYFTPLTKSRFKLKI